VLPIATFIVLVIVILIVIDRVIGSAVAIAFANAEKRARTSVRRGTIMIKSTITNTRRRTSWSGMAGTVIFWR
jgi:hypothetical protein